MSRPSWQLRDAALGYASRGIPVLPLHYPLPHRGDLQPVTGDRQLPALRWGRAARVGIRAAASSPSTPWAAWSPTGSRTPPPTGPGSWPGGPATPRPTSAWPPATASTSWTSTAPPAPRPSATLAAAHGLAELGAAGPHRRGWLALLPGPHRPRQRPPPRPGACGLAGPGRLCGRPTQPPRLRPPLPVGRRPRPRHPARPRFPRCCCERLQPRQLQRPTGPVQLPAAGDGPGDRYARAALAQELARVATAPVGQRNRQLWESTRNLYNLVATGALDHREVDQGLLAGRRTLRAARRGAPPDPPHPGLGPPGRPGPPRPPTPSPPAPNAPMPRRPRCGRSASEPRRGGEGHGRRRPPGRLSRVHGVGACRRQAEPAPTPTTPQEGALHGQPLQP